MTHPKKILLSPTPPLMNGSALLLWGWQCDFLLYAIVMAVLLESARIIHWRIPITEKEFNHISDLSSAIFLITVVYVFSTRSYHGIFTILALLPFLLYLLILAQDWSVQGNIKPGALFMSMRRKIDDELSIHDIEVNLSYPYLFVCMISASAGNQWENLFYVFVIVLVAWVLWTLRPRHTTTAIWILLLTIGAVSGYAGQIGMKRIQAYTEATFMGWFEQYMWRSRDPHRTSTAIGSLGKLKLSDRIMVRINTHGKELKQPLLLREATYTNYAYSVWTNYHTALRLIDPTPDGKQWIIDDQITGDEKLTVSFFMDDETAIVPVPMGLSNISNVQAAQIEHSAYGALSIELNPGWIKYDTLFNNEHINDALPGKEDLDIPAIYLDELHGLANQLGLEYQLPGQKVATVKKFFAENFEYSLTWTERYPRAKYLSKFLFETRKGHCEYFATATSLLLRAAGVPTRYVVGYAVNEYSPLERQYVGRARHAHSWVLAHVNDKWEVIDTTPPIWAPLEAMDRSFIEPLVDLWSWLAYTLSTWEDDESEDDNTSTIFWLLVPILFYYLWRMFIKDNAQNIKKRKNKKQVSGRFAGADSAFYQLLPVLEARYVPRKPGETLTVWLAKIQGYIPNLDLHELLVLHYRYRFDPEGLNNSEKQLLENKVNKQLTTLR